MKKSNIHDLTLEDFKSITEINLANKRIVGQIPDYIGVMTNLTTLKLNGNDLRNSIPSTIGNLDNLKVLNLSENRLTGEIPESLGGLETLRNLCLDYNQLIGQVPKSVSDLAATKDFRYNFLENENKQNTISIKPKAKITLNIDKEIDYSTIKNNVNIVTSINKNDVLNNLYSLTLKFEDENFVENNIAIKTGETKAKVTIQYKDIDNPTTTSTSYIDVIIK